MSPKVSVNICCYNGEKFIKDAIESVRKQTFDDFEIIFINDGSTDSTKEVIKKIDDPRIRYFYQEHTGLGAARNKAIEFSRADYIAFLDCDDIWEPEKLELQVKVLDDDPEIGLVHSDGYTVTEDNRIIGRFFQTRHPVRGYMIEDLIKDYRIACSAAVIRKGLLNKIGYFRNDFKVSEEYDLFLRMSLVARFDYIDKVLIRYRLHPDNISRNTERLFGEGVISLDDLLNKVDSYHLKRCIKRQLSVFHGELAEFYLLNRVPDKAKKEIQLAIGSHEYGPWILLLHLFSYLPGRIRYPAVWFMKKVRSFFRRIKFGIRG